MSLEFTINTDFLEMIDPPSTFPPNEQELVIQIQNKFLSECQRFISNQKMLYKCSKGIESRLKSILNNSESVQQNLSTHKEKFESINKELEKYKVQRQSLKERQKVLKMLCDLIKMQEIRQQLLIPVDKSKLQTMNKMTTTNEDEYLGKLQRLNETIEQSSALQHFKQQFPLIKDIVIQLQAIFRQAVQYLLKQLMTPRMVDLVLNKYSHIFFGNKPIHLLFYDALVRNRVQSMKIGLNPMINSLNYASNIPQLYQSILTTWIQMLQTEVRLFTHSQQFGVIKQANNLLISELIPKMEKNIFRIKELVQVVRIRKYFSSFRIQLQSITQLKNKEGKEQRYESIIGLIVKSEAIIQSQLTQQSEALQNAKYNIYTLVSYIPIREHLQKLKLCYQYSTEGENIDWQVAFYNLFSSRDPKNYPNNKSLMIFNLNIWYLYLKLIVNGKYRKEGQQLIRWCKDTFTTINVQQTNKKYYESFDKMLQLGGNITAFRNTLFSEIQLLGHQELRRDLAQSIKKRYLDGYEAILAKIDKQPMNNQQTKAFCASKKINLNKFGKFSQSVCILSKQDLEEHLEYI